MSLQDDHFDLEAYFKRRVRITKKGTLARREAESARAAYQRVWEWLVEIENENEKLFPVVGAVTKLVRHVIDTHYVDVKTLTKRPE